MSKFSIKKCDYLQLNELVANDTTLQLQKDWFVYENFIYFSNIDTRACDDTFYVALNNCSIAGILKVKRFEDKTFNFVKDIDALKTNNHIGIKYLDVKENFKQQGVSKLLLNQFAYDTKLLNPKQTIVSSFFTKQGLLAKLDENIKSAFPNSKIFVQN